MGYHVLMLCFILASTAVGKDEELDEQSKKSSIFGELKLVCIMDKECNKRQQCELPCKVQGSAQSDQVITSTNFIDEEFEELWDEMQEKMKGLNDHQAELIAQQHDLFKEQQRLEFENRRLKDQQSDLLERQEILEQENERLRTLEPGSKDAEEIQKTIRELEKKISVLTEQQQKLSGQQSRLVEQQNRLMQRQRKLEQENANLKKRQERIEQLAVKEDEEDEEDAVSEDVAEPETRPVDPRIESKLESIKKEMEYRISQLTGQQEELLREQTKLINRQIRLEEENQALKQKQLELYEKQEQLEKENQELKANITHRAQDPEIRRQRIESSGLCEIIHGDICFGLLGDGTDELTLELADLNCKAYGGNLANIYDQEHYDKIKEYFLQKKLKSGVWLGMTFNPQNQKVLLTDGKVSNFVKWNFFYPLTFASYTGIYLFIDTDPKSIYSGMVNLPPTWKYPYALCQFGV